MTRVMRNWATALREDGRLTLQIPHLHVSLEGMPGVEKSDPPDLIDIPDQWVCRLQGSAKPAVGKMDGFLYISRIGYEANKGKILSAVAKGALTRYGIETPINFGSPHEIRAMINRLEVRVISEFERFAHNQFEQVRKNHHQMIEQVRREVERRKASGTLTPSWQSKLDELEAFPI